MAKKTTLIIQWIGAKPINRTVGKYRWSAENNYQCAVDLETAANLLTYPVQNFAVASGQKPTAATKKKLAELTGAEPAEIAAIFGGNE